MNFTCSECQRRYVIADEKVRGRTVSIRCKNCQALITLQGPDEAPPEEEGATRAFSAADMERLRAAATSGFAPAPAPAPAPGAAWFTMMQGQQVGPLTEAGLQAQVQAGTLSAQSYFWREGMAEWRRGGELPELARLFPAAPAAPAPMAPAAAAPVESRGEALSGLFDGLDPTRTNIKVPGFGQAPEASRAPAAPKRRPGDTTRPFRNLTGSRRRFSPWLPASVLAGLALLAAVLWAVGVLPPGLLPVDVARLQAELQAEVPFLTAEGLAGLRDTLLGRTPPARTESAPVAPKNRVAEKAPVVAPAVARGSGDTAPASAPAAPSPAVEEHPGPPVENVARVVGARKATFQRCAKQERRRNPRFKGGKVMLTVTVTAKGTVKRAVLDRDDLERAPVGKCLTAAARRMRFASFQGADVELEVPVDLGRGK